MKSFIEKVFIHSNKEDNFELEDRAEDLGFRTAKEFLYIGYEICFETELFEDGTNKVLKINGIDVSDKNISI
jgi:hypothetical protein